MKKILFICDGANFSKGAFEFLKMLDDYKRISVKGIFFEPIDFQELISVSYIPIAKPYVKLKESEHKLMAKSKQEFEKSCDMFHINMLKCNDENEWDANSFAKETRFADLAIMSEELFCSEISSNQPNLFMKEALRAAECPVILVPENFKSLDRIAIAYDGKPESMFALKQFCNLLPELNETPIELVYIKSEESDDIPDLLLLKEYTRFHFNNLAVSKLHFDAKKYFSTWAEEKKNLLLVAGSFSRTAISDFMKGSFVKEIVHEHKLPVFISHH